jgi:hypothetical protein
LPESANEGSIRKPKSPEPAVATATAAIANLPPPESALAEVEKRGLDPSLRIPDRRREDRARENILLLLKFSSSRKREREREKRRERWRGDSELEKNRQC